MDKFLLIMAVACTFWLVACVSDFAIDNLKWKTSPRSVAEECL